MPKITFEDYEKVQKELQKEFEPDDIEWRIGAINQEKTKGLALPYVTNRAIQNRLDEIFTPFGWRNEYKPWQDKAQICGISVKIVDYDNSIQWITKWDGADNTELEAIKGGLSDSMKRCAVQWGIGRYLYTLPPVWVDIEQKGKTCVIKHYEFDRLKTFLKTKKWTWGENNNGADDSPTGQNVPSAKGSTAPKQGNNPKEDGTGEGKEVRKATTGQINCLLKNIKVVGLTVDEIKGLTFERADELIQGLSKNGSKGKEDKKGEGASKGQEDNKEDKKDVSNESEKETKNKSNDASTDKMDAQEVKNDTSKNEDASKKIESSTSTEKPDHGSEPQQEAQKVETISNGQKGLITSLIKQISVDTKQNSHNIENLLFKEFKISSVDSLPKAKFSPAVSYLKSLFN
jgi:hypothetical protein